MKKLKSIVLVLMACGLIGSCLVGCAPTAIEKTDDMPASSSFVIVEETGTYAVAYDKETKVMYAISRGSYNMGTFTLLVNPDGSPKVYGETWEAESPSSEKSDVSRLK